TPTPNMWVIPQSDPSLNAHARQCRVAWSSFARIFLGFTCGALAVTATAYTPVGLPATAAAPDNSPLETTVSIGRRLFFDKRLSADGTISCASCHKPDKAFTDGL